MCIKRIAFNCLCLLVSSLLLVACINDKEEETGQVELQVGERLPDFSVRMHDGRQLTTADLRGKVSLIVFFHTDCKDCQQELPVIQRIYETYSDQIALLCISRAEKESEIQAYWKAHDLTLPYSAQDTREVYHLFAKSGIPRLYVVDKYLVIRAIFTDNPLADYAEIVDQLERVEKGTSGRTL